MRHHPVSGRPGTPSGYGQTRGRALGQGAADRRRGLCRRTAGPLVRPGAGRVSAQPRAASLRLGAAARQPDRRSGRGQPGTWPQRSGQGRRAAGRYSGRPPGRRRSGRAGPGSGDAADSRARAHGAGRHRPGSAGTGRLCRRGRPETRPSGSGHPGRGRPAVQSPVQPPARRNPLRRPGTFPPGQDPGRRGLHLPGRPGTPGRQPSPGGPHPGVSQARKASFPLSGAPAPAGRWRRPHPYHLQQSGHGHGPVVELQSQPAKHSHTHRKRQGNPQSFYSAQRRLSPAFGRLFPDRTPDYCFPKPGRRNDGCFPSGTRHPCRHRCKSFWR